MWRPHFFLKKNIEIIDFYPYWLRDDIETFQSNELSLTSERKYHDNAETIIITYYIQHHFKHSFYTILIIKKLSFVYLETELIMQLNDSSLRQLALLFAYNEK